MLMKFKELKNMTKEELDKRLADIRMELMKLNAQVALGTVPKSTKQIRELKKNLARVSTLKMQGFQKELDIIKTPARATRASHADAVPVAAKAKTNTLVKKRKYTHH
jgi:large subunit ribosomal protein L29